MSTLVIDASVAVKWVVEEEGTSAALALRGKAKLMAPDLLVPECANILWKKAERGELSKEAAQLASRLLERADIELRPMRGLLEAATRLALELGHPAYDCFYLALAIEIDSRFVTADGRFLRKLGQVRQRKVRQAAISLTEAAADH